ncbi:Putative signal peptide peptidase [Caenispirillum salinarum AK4]|uniref:Putative signal peptide peptidase n=1 Tax=Caenispirillum salinarum AK4 TaxID=1238182 RepID=K9H4E7_9PROT|nr:S49 family peptidase [Caenispirillum salinarum]EKV32447.1 Putative signal peptide peptidase [Caenispirillum salinarum AK4]
MKLKFWQRRRVNVLRLDGMVGGRGLRLEKVGPALDKAFSGKPEAVVMIVNSPGGSPMESDVIAADIRRRADDKKVPVFAFIEQVGASGGYWIACAADEIYAMSGMTLVGSIGVLSAGFGFTGLMDRIGVERRVTTHGANKMRLDPFQPQKEADREWLKGLQADIHAAFIKHVRSRRGDKLKGEDHTLFNGDVFLGEKGLELGLIDGVDLPDAFIKRRFKDAKPHRIHGPRKPLLARLLRGGSDALAEEMMETALRARLGL